MRNVLVIIAARIEIGPPTKSRQMLDATSKTAVMTAHTLKGRTLVQTDERAFANGHTISRRSSLNLGKASLSGQNFH